MKHHEAETLTLPRGSPPDAPIPELLSWGFSGPGEFPESAEAWSCRQGPWARLVRGLSRCWQVRSRSWFLAAVRGCLGRGDQQGCLLAQRDLQAGHSVGQGPHSVLDVGTCLSPLLPAASSLLTHTLS